MSVPRNHHYIPVFLQKKFVSPKGKLYFFDKSNPRIVFDKSPEQMFQKHDLNTSKNEDGTNNTGLENHYKRLETKAAPVIKKIDELAQSGKTPNLNINEKSDWDVLNYHQHKRAPDVFKKLGAEDKARKNLETQVWKDLGEGKINRKDKDYLLSRRGKYRIIQDASVGARRKENEKLLHQFSISGLLIGVIKPKNKSFIFGDYPRVRFEDENTILNENNAEVWMPISSKVAVTYYQNFGTEQLVYLNREQVRKINKCIYKQSSLVAGRSKALINSLAKFDILKTS